MHVMNGFYPGPPPSYRRPSSVHSDQSQHSSVPAYFTSSLPRYGRYTFNNDPTQGHRDLQRQRSRSSQGLNDGAFDFPKPMTSASAANVRRRSDVTAESVDDVSDSRSRSDARRSSRLADFVPTRTQIPRVALSQPRREISRQSSRDSNLTSSRPAFSRQSTRNDVTSSAGGSNLHRTGATLSLDDLLLSSDAQRPRTRLQRHDDVMTSPRSNFSRTDASTDIPRPRLKRCAENGSGWGRQRSGSSQGRANEAFEDDALRPYYLQEDAEVRNSH